MRYGGRREWLAFVQPPPVVCFTATKISNVDEVLDLLESIALLLKRGVLDEEITWHTFD
jgi:hypothetical protein